MQLGPDAAPHYALEGSIAIAGQGISWLRDRMGFIGSAGEAGWFAGFKIQVAVETQSSCWSVWRSPMQALFVCQCVTNV